MACVSEQPKELRSFDSGEDFIPYLRWTAAEGMLTKQEVTACWPPIRQMNYNFSDYWVVAWLSRNSIRHSNEVTLRQARLVLGWVIIHECAILVYNQPQPLSLVPSVGQYQPRSSPEGNCRSGILLAMHHSAQWPKGDDHHAYIALRSMATFTFTLLRLN